MTNNCMLKGNLTHAPFFDIIPGSDVPFARFYVGVDPNTGMALAVVKGNLTKDPFFNLVGPDDCPFLQFYLAVDRARQEDGQRADFLRVVAYGQRAQLDRPYLQAGSEVLVVGDIRARDRKMRNNRTEKVIEIIAHPDDGITFLHKINYRYGDAQRAKIDLRDDPDPRQRERGGGFFRVVAYGKLAEDVYAHLNVGSPVFVHGRLRSRKVERKQGRGRKTVVEVVAHNISFLEGVMTS